MKILALDTSSPLGSVALGNEKAILSYYENSLKASYNEQLIPLIQKALDAAKIKSSELDLIVTTIGPGSFTGLRIGLATIKGLSYSKNLPIVGLSTLEALTCSTQSKKTTCILDALRGYFFYAEFENQRRLCEDQLLSSDSFFKLVSKETTIIGNGIIKYKTELIENNYNFDENILNPKADKFLHYGLKLFQNKQQTYDFFTLEPQYLQKAYVE